MDPFQQGYEARGLVENPYWLIYPKPTTEQDKIDAYRWIDGYVEKIIHENRLRNATSLSS